MEPTAPPLNNDGLPSNNPVLPPNNSGLPPQPEIIISTQASQPPVPPPPPPKSKQPTVKIIATVYALLFLVVAAAGFLAGFMQSSMPGVKPSPTPSLLPVATTETSPAADQPLTNTPEPTPTPDPESQTKTITSTPTLDGFASSNGSGNNTVDLRVGRNTFAVTRSFISFDLSSLPDNIVVESANLRVYQTHVTGNPYSIGGSLKVDHMEFGDTLDGNDYALAPLQTNLATLTSNTDIEWKEVVVTEAFKEDLKNNRVRSQFRLSFTTETIGGESGGDFAYFESGENFVGTNNIPQLVVRYKN